jgi:photosystem II stability/assembly factor-like uncharacterized protein
MKKLTLIVAFIAYLSGSLFAQTGWYPVYTSSSKTIESIYFTNHNSGYAAGMEWHINNSYYPVIIKTTNSGGNWVVQSTPQSDSDYYAFHSVYFTDENTGFIACGHLSNYNIGRILKTTDGGDSWFIIPLPVDKQMTNVYFINSNTGYATGLETVLKTTDGGNNWALQQTVFNVYLYQIHFTEPNTGYVCGTNGVILKTTNGGYNWVSLFTSVAIDLFGLTFSDMNTGLAVGGSSNGGNIIIRTTNGGNNWEPVPYTSSTCILADVKFANTSTGWISGSCGQILKTTNGGLNWYNQSLFTDHFNKLFLMNSDTVYAGGPGKIMRTTTGGDTLTGIKPINNETPKTFSLQQNYPNPFNPVTKIKFELTKSDLVSLEIYDILGKEVATLIKERLEPGTYEVDWNASNNSSGIYYCRLNSADYSETIKMMLVK